MARVLRLAAATDILAGLLLVASPATPLAWAGLAPPLQPEVWQALGLLLVSYGLGHAVAARNALRRWPLVAVGLVSKILLPLGFAWAAANGRLPWALGVLVLAVGPVWWVPFWGILRGARRAFRAADAPPVLPLDMALSLYQDQQGVDLLEASMDKPLFLVFLRHFGCTFCREAVSDLSEIQKRLSASGTRLVLVHMSTEGEAREFFTNHGVPEVTAISDPDRVLYRAFALRRGSPSQLLGWSVWKRGWEAGVKKGHGIGWLRGDAAQMPGAFVVSHGNVVAQFVHETAAERPDYVQVAEEGVDHAAFQDDLEREDLGRGFQDRLRELLTSEATSQG